MNLLMVAESFPSPEHPYRGSFIGEQVKRLLEHVDRITVLCPTTCVPQFAKFSRVAVQASQPTHYELVKDRCEVLFPRYLKAPGDMCLWWTTAQWCRLVSRTVRELIETQSLSLIHANKGGLSSWSSIQAAREYGLPCVVTYQGTEVHTDLVNQQKEWKLCRDSFRLADLNILVSRSLERTLKACVQPQGRCEVMLRGVDLTMFFPPVAEDVRRPIILFVGRVTEAKGVFDLLEAWRGITTRCACAELWIVGPHHRDARFLRAIESCGQSRSIRVLGPLPLREVADLMRQVQALCLPSHGEGTPNCVMEAMACGLPVVATEVGGIPDIVESNRTGMLVRKGDTQGLADALVSLLQDSDRRASMGEAAHAFAVEHFDARKTAERLVGWYRELVTESRGAVKTRTRVETKR
jgi:glycosyltransferase involved in cell wall biosynthesis